MMGFSGVQQQPVLMRVEPLVRPADEPVRGIEQRTGHRRQRVRFEKASARRQSPLRPDRPLRARCPEKQGVRIAGVQFERLREIAHRVGQLTALVADEAEQRVAVGRVRREVDQRACLGLGAREVRRVRAHAGAQLRDPHVRAQRAQRWRQPFDLDRAVQQRVHLVHRARRIGAPAPAPSSTARTPARS